MTSLTSAVIILLCAGGGVMGAPGRLAALTALKSL